MKNQIFVVLILGCLVAIFATACNGNCTIDRDCPYNYFCGGDYFCHQYGTDPRIAGGLCASGDDCASMSLCLHDIGQEECYGQYNCQYYGHCWPHSTPEYTYDPHHGCYGDSRYDPDTDSCYMPECDSPWDCPIEGTGEYGNCSPEGFCEPLIACTSTPECESELGSQYRCYFGYCRYDVNY